MGKPTELDKLCNGYAVKPGVKQLARPLKIFGFDSETDVFGKVIVLAASCYSLPSEDCYSFGEPIDDILGFLTRDSFRWSCNFFFNLGFDHNSLFKSVLSVSELDVLCRVGLINHPPYRIDMINGKMLRIVKNGKIWRFFDIANFYRGGASGRLVDVYKATFGEDYIKRMDASNEFDVINDDVVRYCIEDARACARLSENLVFPANRLVPMNKFFSGASIAKKILQQNLKAAYRFSPSRLQQFALNAYGGARIEVFKRGGWGFNDNDKLYMYDIRSAYPSVQCDLTAIEGYKTSRSLCYEPEASHSFFKINVKIEDAIVGPLKYRFGNIIFYPVGECADIWVDKNEVELLLDYDVRFQILEAEHDLSRPQDKPYEYLKNLYNQRLKYKKSDKLEERQLDFPLKTALASSYGILIERNAKKRIVDKPTDDELNDVDTTTFNDNGIVRACVSEWKSGQFFNPVHACEVTSAIRCKLYRDSEPYQEHLIKFATDSMTFDKRIKLDFGEKLGQYEDSPAYNQAIVIGCGVYSMVSEGKKVNKFRSFDSHNIIDLAMNNADASKIKIVKKSPVKLKESKMERYVWFNTFQEKRKRLDINFDKRRNWSPKTIKDFKTLMKSHYDSMPLSFMDMVKIGRIPSYKMVIDDTIDMHALNDSTLSRGENKDNLRILMREQIKL